MQCTRWRLSHQRLNHGVSHGKSHHTSYEPPQTWPLPLCTLWVYKPAPKNWGVHLSCPAVVKGYFVLHFLTGQKGVDNPTNEVDIPRIGQSETIFWLFATCDNLRSCATLPVCQCAQGAVLRFQFFQRLVRRCSTCVEWWSTLITQVWRHSMSTFRFPKIFPCHFPTPKWGFLIPRWTSCSDVHISSTFGWLVEKFTHCTRPKDSPVSAWESWDSQGDLLPRHGCRMD